MNTQVTPNMTPIRNVRDGGKLNSLNFTNTRIDTEGDSKNKLRTYLMMSNERSQLSKDLYPN